MPATGCSSTPSSRPVQVSGRLGGVTQALRMRSASRCRARISAAEGSRQASAAATRGRGRPGARSRPTRTSMPRRRVATVATTGMPSSRDRPLEVDLQALALGDVDHVERQHHRPADRLQLQRQAQDQAQVGGVGDADHHVGRRLAGQPAQHRVAGDLLVRAAGAQGIGAGQVEDGHRAAVWRRSGGLPCARR